MNWLDSHCHINDSAFDEDLDEVLNRMVESDVTKATIISCQPEDFIKARTISKEGIQFKRSLGVYPGDVDEIDEKRYQEYEALQREKDCILIGEIGLDYHYHPENRERQKEFFIRQIELAKELDKPIIVHSREAAQDTFDIMKEHRCRGVLHCYSGSAEMAKEFVKLGYYISIAGTITFKNAKEPLEVIKAIPLERLLIETDCPYLTPVPKRGQRNEPSNVVLTARRIIEELGIDEEEFKTIINRNYEELFR